MKRNNPVYAKMFAKLSTMTIDELTNVVALLRVSLNYLAEEQLLTYSCAWEELEYRTGDEFDSIIENIDSAIAA